MKINWTRDEIILVCDIVWQREWKSLDASDPSVIEVSELLQLYPLHPPEDRDEVFRNPNGVGRKSADIATRRPGYSGKPTRGNKLDIEVMEDFLENPIRMHDVASEIRATILSGQVPGGLQTDPEVEQTEATEGALLLARHLRRERSPRLRRAKILQAKKNGRPINCEVCTFNFERMYGDRGVDYIEVHHVLPLHVSGETKTKLADLAMLCANCHRMIHKGRDWLTPDELKSVVLRNNVALDSKSSRELKDVRG